MTRPVACDDLLVRSLPDSAWGRGVSRRDAPTLRVTILLSVRVHCCGELDMPLPLTWRGAFVEVVADCAGRNRRCARRDPPPLLGCLALRDQRPNCQRATGPRQTEPGRV